MLFKMFKRLPRVLACNNSCAVERRLCTANLDSFILIDSKDTLSKVSMMSRFFKGKKDGDKWASYYPP